MSGGVAISERTPTPEQAAAIAVSGRDALLEAGAGTGKTGVMVERYCRLVCDEGVPPDAILAFTFTDKAAAELRQRIRAELGRRAELGSERAASSARKRSNRRSTRRFIARSAGWSPSSRSAATSLRCRSPRAIHSGREAGRGSGSPPGRSS
jgi:ATP-dependent exoDNAse (exonuclease V) beta subunit